MNCHPLQQISFNIASNAYVIEASAGTGKTWTIERLFIKALLEAEIDSPASNIPIAVENILVVTFTNDATNELKQRISEQLQLTINQLIYLQQANIEFDESDIFTQYLISRQQISDYRKDLNILTRALQNFDMASIYTIHGFCNKILHDYQFECNVNARFDLITDKSSILETLVLNFIRSEIINNSELIPHIDVVLDNLSKLFNSSKDLIVGLLNALPKDLFIIHNNEYQLKYNICVDNLTLSALINPELFVNIEGSSKKAIAEKQLKKEMQIECKAVVLKCLVDYISTKYSTLSAKSNMLSNDELIQKVADAVKNSVQLCDKIFNRYPIVFIDEFQDTDLLQWQIFSTIYQLHKNKRGNVVVVGDPKQAIYRFRGADVNTYINARNVINNQLELTMNFRSHPNIMNFVNQLFSLENQNSTVEDSFLGREINCTAINAGAIAENNLPRSNELRITANDYGINCDFYDDEVHLITITGAKKATRHELLLKSLTFEILMLLKAEPNLLGKIAILVTKNKEATELVKYLRKYGVKAAQAKLGSVFATDMANEIYIILRSLNDLGNRKNFIRASCCKIFGISLSVLGSEIGATNAQTDLNRRFFTYKQIWEKYGIITLIYSIISDINQTKLMLTNRDMSNIWQLAELLNRHSQAINHNQIELLHWFKKKIDEADLEINKDIDGNSDEVLRLDNDDEQVIISTQHNSKGLEYDVLFCPYFKGESKLDGRFNYSHQRPFFSNYQQNTVQKSELILDAKLGEYIVHNDNKEIHRLNYVALTRAKSRIYLYLKQQTVTKTGKYDAKENPDKLNELFGYDKNDSQNTAHKLFDYTKIFTLSPSSAIKNPELLPGVIVYNRENITHADLNKIRFIANDSSGKMLNFQYVRRDFSCAQSYKRQSYSGLTRVNNTNDVADYYVKNELKPANEIKYRYSILHDSQLRGAIFGVLFHELCENYPFNRQQISDILRKHNVKYDDNDYLPQLASIITEAFNYPIFSENGRIIDFTHSMHELKFNLTVKNQVHMQNDIFHLISKHFGVEHPYSKACRTLSIIEPGFLLGFIDLFFEYNGKYWVLDYKTNSLADYTSCDTYTNIDDNSLIESMAEHHYYLQYLLYLVAIKRYLESRFAIDDATNLIGGAVYYFVRGIYTEPQRDNVALVIDDKCQNIVRELDRLLLL